MLALYREPPADGVVVCFDEMGPIQLIPHQGSGWAPEGMAERLRATYNRKGGVRYLYGAFDVHRDYLHGRLRPRKGEREVIGFFSQIRMRFDPRLRIYLIQDNLSCHWTPKVRAWAEAANMELVATPTYASYLNRIECHFWGLGEFVVKNADYESWEQLSRAMAAHISYRNGPPPRSSPDRDRAAQAGGLRMGYGWNVSGRPTSRLAGSRLDLRYRPASARLASRRAAFGPRTDRNAREVHPAVTLRPGRGLPPTTRL